MHFENEPDQRRLLMNVILACNQLCFFFAVKKVDPEQDASSV